MKSLYCLSRNKAQFTKFRDIIFSLFTSTFQTSHKRFFLNGTTAEYWCLRDQLAPNRVTEKRPFFPASRTNVTHYSYESFFQYFNFVLFYSKCPPFFRIILLLGSTRVKIKVWLTKFQWKFLKAMDRWRVHQICTLIRKYIGTLW